VLASGATSSIFTAPPCSSTTHPTLPKPNFDPSSFAFQTSSFPLEPAQFPTYTYSQPPRYEFTAGQEKTTKTAEQEEIARKMRSMEQNLKSIQGLSGQKSVSYADLCMFPHVHLPLGFKTPKFEKYDGHNDPTAHLKRYCNQLRGVGGKEELLMAYFGESLVGLASEWYMDQDISRWHIWDDLARYFVRQFQYNIDIAPDRNSLTNLKKKSSESFQEYAIKWREQDSRVKPPMDEVEMVTVFLQAQEADYFQNMMSAMGKPFAKAIKIGEMAIQGGSGGVAKGKKKEETSMAASVARKHRTPRSLFTERSPQHYYPHQDVAYAPHPFPVMNAQPYIRPQQQANRNQAPFPRNQPPYQAHYNPRPPQNNFRAREPPRKSNFTPIGESYSSLFPKLVQMGLLQPVPPNRQNPESPSY
uniref:Retrotransposon gag domain-containing protein n=1 Tax=Nicotiana tabacum TaxID=4097 RepID=A0A1S3ZGJ4_TOBAC